VKAGELSADTVLRTTRAVRKRLDLTRPVPHEVIRECLELALQAPTGSNRQNWHFVVVTDTDKKAALGDLYNRALHAARGEVAHLTRIEPDDTAAYEAQTARVMDSAGYLFEHIGQVPAMLIPCLSGRLQTSSPSALASQIGSIIPAAWSFMLAARARGLGSVWTTVHLALEEEAADLLGIPYAEITQLALIPFGYVTGDPFKPARREPLDLVTHWDSW
jgi:nitroreductase